MQISPIDIDFCQKTDILHQDFETFDLTHKSNDGCLRFFSNPNSKFWTHRPPLSDLRASKMTSVEMSFFTSLIVDPYSTADLTGHMSFLAGQDGTSKFAGQVQPDQTESGLIFSTFYIPSTGYQLS